MEHEQPPSPSQGEATLRASAADLPGAQLEDLVRHDRYAPGPVIGKGGMGEVRQCKDLRLHRDIALKTATTKNRAELSRFVREAQVQGQLEHPGIVPVHELGLGADGAPYFAMKRVQGETLFDVLDRLAVQDPRAREKFPRHKLLQAFQAVCQAVDYAHTHGWIHRDLKPANVMLGDFGEVYVLDWGLARRAEEKEDVSKLETFVSAPGLTTPGSLMGTPGYMAPEQVHGQPADVRSDVYALGAILFELLTHQMLARGNSAIELLVETKSGCDARARARAPHLDVPPELEAICVKAAHLDPAQRYPTVRELHAAVDRVLAGERDHELREALAKEHTETAKEAIARAVSDVAHELDHRKTALRELGLALALIPQHRPALEALLGVMATPLHQAPAEADAELAAGLALQRRTASRTGFFTFLGLALFGLLLHGHAFTVPGLLFAGLCAACSLFCAWGAWRRREPTGWELVLGAAVSMLCVSSLFLLDGPMPSLPLFAAVNTMAFATVAGRRERPLIIALGAVTAVLPLLGSWFGVLPESFRFVKEGLLMLPMDGYEDPTSITLMYAVSFAFAVVLPGILVGNVSDAVSALTRRSALQAWNLRQMLPAEAAVAPAVEPRAAVVAACPVTAPPAAAPR